MSLLLAIVAPTAIADTDTDDDYIYIEQATPVTIEDALDILKYIANIIELTPERFAQLDMDGDGELTVKDALEVLKGLAGIIELPELISMIPELRPVTKPTETDNDKAPDDTDKAPDATETEGTSVWIDGDNDYSALFAVLGEFHNTTPPMILTQPNQPTQPTPPTTVVDAGTRAVADSTAPAEDMTAPATTPAATANMTTVVNNTAMASSVQSAPNAPQVGGNTQDDWAWGSDWEMPGTETAQMPEMSEPAATGTVCGVCLNTPCVCSAIINEDAADNDGNDLDFSDTNNQVEGVQEADIVKTNGRYIFAASTTDRNNLRVSIVAVDNGDMELTQQLKFPNAAALHEMLLYDGQLIIIWNKADAVFVDIYDTDGDFSEPFSTYSQKGAFNSARMIDNNIYLITTFRPILPRTIDQTNIEQCIPYFETNGEKHLVPACMINIPQKLDSIVYTVIGGLDVYRENMVVSIQANLGTTDIIYSSMDNVYVIRSNTVMRNIIPSATTVIDKFSIERGRVQYVANAQVIGSARNQFHFDEHNGYFRAVTEVWGYKPVEDNFMGKGSWQMLPLPDSKGWWDERRNTNWDSDFGLQGGVLFTFDENMNVLAEVHRIGFGENVHSVRFMGDLAYIVTFWQTDPLFAFDLSDPMNPVLLGELKIPGFSRYMQPWGDGLLLGMGVDTNERGFRVGLKLTMFDTSDNEDLIEKHVVQFGRNGNSAYENDHRAALVSPRRNIIGFPYVANNTAFYAVYSYDKDGGFSLVGEIAVVPQRSDIGFFCDCWSCQGMWFSTGSTTTRIMQFQRGLFIGDYIYAISDNLIVSAQLGESLTEIMRLEL
jgi:uncharacterized secreted protein with C-terminal beta-propeller domain